MEKTLKLKEVELKWKKINRLVFKAEEIIENLNDAFSDIKEYTHQSFPNLCNYFNDLRRELNFLYFLIKLQENKEETKEKLNII